MNLGSQLLQPQQIWWRGSYHIGVQKHEHQSSHHLSLSKTHIYTFVPLHRKSICVVDLSKLAEWDRSHLLSSMVELMRPITHHSKNPDRPLSLLQGFSFFLLLFCFWGVGLIMIWLWWGYGLWLVVVMDCGRGGGGAKLWVLIVVVEKKISYHLWQFLTQVWRFPKANDFFAKSKQQWLAADCPSFSFLGVHATSKVNPNTLNYLRKEADRRDFKRCGL